MYIINATLIKTQPMIVHCDEFSIEICYIWTYIALNSIYLKLCLLKLASQQKQITKIPLI